MTTPYNGVDIFSSMIELMQDSDSPRAQLFRVPNERLLDNDIHLRNRVARREASGQLTSVNTITDTTPVALAQKSIPAAQLAAGSIIRFGGQARARRGSTATAVNVLLTVTVNGNLVYGDSVALNTTNTYVGMLRNSGEILIAGAAGAATPILVSGVSHSTINSATVAVGLLDAGLSLTADLTGNVVVAVAAQLDAAIANVQLTGLHGFIQVFT